MSEENCIFCDIVAGKVPAFKIYEDERTLAFADINPATPGHCLVISKTHSPNLMELTPGDLAAVHQTSQKVARALVKSMGAEGVMVAQLNGEAAGQIIFHYHVHLIPRSAGDGFNIQWETKPGDKEEIAANAEKIKEAM